MMKLPISSLFAREKRPFVVRSSFSFDTTPSTVLIDQCLYSRCLFSDGSLSPYVYALATGNVLADGARLPRLITVRTVSESANRDEPSGLRTNMCVLYVINRGDFLQAIITACVTGRWVHV